MRSIILSPRKRRRRFLGDLGFAFGHLVLDVKYLFFFFRKMYLYRDYPPFVLHKSTFFLLIISSKKVSVTEHMEKGIGDVPLQADYGIFTGGKNAVIEPFE